MLMTLIIVLAILALAGVAYVVVVLLEVPGVREERFGSGGSSSWPVGEWTPDRDSDAGRRALAAGHLREVRLWRERHSGIFRHGRLWRQARTIDPRSGEVLSVEPDIRHRRRDG